MLGLLSGRHGFGDQLSRGRSKRASDFNLRHDPLGKARSILDGVLLPCWRGLATSPITMNDDPKQMCCAPILDVKGGVSLISCNLGTNNFKCEIIC